MNTKYKLFLSIFSLVALSCTMEILAQSPPVTQVSLEKTMDWLRTKINDNSVEHYELKVPILGVGLQRTTEDRSTKFVTYDGCTLKLRQTVIQDTKALSTDLPATNNSMTTEVEIDLSYLSSISADQGGYKGYGDSYDVQIHTEGKRIKKSRLEVDSESGRSRNDYVDDLIYIGFGSPRVDNQEVANSVKKAFDNLRTLCRDKRKSSNEPFGN